ncbi:unnamed protein product [Choristocarpus tenellus]
MITGISMRKTQDLFRKEDFSTPFARLTFVGSSLSSRWAPSVGAEVEAEERTIGMNMNEGLKRIRFNFARTFAQNRLRVVLNPLVTYGRQRHDKIDFRAWVPRYSPLVSEEGMPSMSLEQRSLVWDWTQGLPRQSPLHGLGISLRLRTGSRGWLSASLLDARVPTRLWTLRADVPLVEPSDVRFSMERMWQVRTG